MSVKTNDPNQVAVIVGGRPITGFAPDSVIKIVQKEPTFTSVTGVDGETVRTKSNPKPIVEITISLMESSASNSFLSSLHEVDRAEPNGAGVVPFMYADLNGTTVFATDKCWVTMPPDIEKGKEAKTREWKLEAETKTRLDGQM